MPSNAAAAAEKAEKALPLLERGKAGKADDAVLVTGLATGLSRTSTATVLAPNPPPVHWHLIWAGVAGESTSFRPGNKSLSPIPFTCTLLCR